MHARVPVSDLARTYLNSRASAGLGTRIIWWVIPIFAVAFGIIFLVWAMPILLAWADGMPSPRQLHKNSLQPGVMVLHTLPGVIALLIGPLQLSAFLRAARPRVHRWLGRIYVALVLPAAGASLFLFSRTDKFGEDFLTVLAGSLWIAFTLLGVMKIRQRDAAAHRRWMMRSYALAWLAITVGLYFTLANNLGIPLDYAWPASRWLALATNLLFVEIIVRRSSVRTSMIHTRNISFTPK